MDAGRKRARPIIMTTIAMCGGMLPSALALDSGGEFRAPMAIAVIGGLTMGYGARLAYGCNIGAFFSGLSSASLHGWLWIVCAFVGSILGTRLRPLFRLD